MFGYNFYTLQHPKSISSQGRRIVISFYMQNVYISVTLIPNTRPRIFYLLRAANIPNTSSRIRYLLRAANIPKIRSRICYAANIPNTSCRTCYLLRAANIPNISSTSASSYRPTCKMPFLTVPDTL
jgi:hypothetical protein